MHVSIQQARIKEKMMTEKVMRETEILRDLSAEGHPHVVRLFEFIETPTKYFMVCVCVCVCVCVRV